MTETKPSAIIQMKWDLMSGIRVAIDAQFENIHQASKYLLVTADRLYRMNEENHDNYSLAWLVMVLDRLNATVSIKVIVAKPVDLSKVTLPAPGARRWNDQYFNPRALNVT